MWCPQLGFMFCFGCIITISYAYRVVAQMNRSYVCFLHLKAIKHGKYFTNLASFRPTLCTIFLAKKPLDETFGRITPITNVFVFPQKTHMDPETHSFEKKQFHLPSTYISGFQPLVLESVYGFLTFISHKSWFFEGGFFCPPL